MNIIPNVGINPEVSENQPSNRRMAVKQQIQKNINATNNKRFTGLPLDQLSKADQLAVATLQKKAALKNAQVQSAKEYATQNKDALADLQLVRSAYQNNAQQWKEAQVYAKNQMVPGKRYMQKHLFQKFLNNIIQQYTQDTGQQPTQQQIRALELMLYTDDFDVYGTARQAAQLGGRFIRYAAPIVTALSDVGVLPGVVGNVASALSQFLDVDRTTIKLNQFDQVPTDNVFDKVNSYALATILCPEQQQSRIPFTNGGVCKTAIARGSATYNLSTDSNGNGFLVIYADNLGNAGATLLSAFVQNYPTNPLVALPSYVPSTGAYTFAQSNFIQGPLFSQAASFAAPVTGAITKMSVSGMSIICTPMTSLNNSQGNYYFSYYQESPNEIGQSGGGTQVVSQPNLVLATYKHESNFMHETRLIYIDDEFSNFAAPNGGQGAPDFNINYNAYQITVVGAQPSTAVLRVTVNYVAEFFPTASAYNICATEYAYEGPATDATLCALLRRYPALALASVDSARCYANQLTSMDQPTSEEVMRIGCHISTVSKL